MGQSSERVRSCGGFAGEDTVDAVPRIDPPRVAQIVFEGQGPGARLELNAGGGEQCAHHPVPVDPRSPQQAPLVEQEGMPRAAPWRLTIPDEHGLGSELQLAEPQSHATSVAGIALYIVEDGRKLARVQPDPSR